MYRNKTNALLLYEIITRRHIIPYDDMKVSVTYILVFILQKKWDFSVNVFFLNTRVYIDFFCRPGKVSLL